METNIVEFPAALRWIVATRNLIYQPESEVPRYLELQFPYPSHAPAFNTQSSRPTCLRKETEFGLFIKCSLRHPQHATQ